MDNYITIKNDKNEEKEFEILFSFESDNTNKKYITYTDYSKDDNGNIICYSSILEDDGKLSKIDTEPELKIIDEMLNTLVETTKLQYLNEEL